MQKRLLAFLGAGLVLLFGCATTPTTFGGSLVAINQQEAAFTIYVGIPAEKREDMQAWLPKEEGWDVVGLDAFRRDPDQYLRARVVKDEYPGSRAVQGVVELVQKFPGAPIGLTWNGGVAITHNDYQHAIRTYQQYMADPAEYDRTRIRDAQRDPVNPAGHLGPLLGW